MNPDNSHIPVTDGDTSNVPFDTTDSMPDTENPLSAGPEAESADITLLQQELAAQKHKYQQLATDFDKYIKRSQRDSEQQAAAEKEGFIRNLLPIIDNLERALASGQVDASDPLFEGVRMTLQQLGQLLGKHGIEPVADKGRPFDPRRHEAVSVQCDPSQPDRIILAVTERGYWRGDKVFRPAKVIVNDLRHDSGAHYAR
jgi:molecular chaperone GrpE